MEIQDDIYNHVSAKSYYHFTHKQKRSYHYIFVPLPN